MRIVLDELRSLAKSATEILGFRFHPCLLLGKGMARLGRRRGRPRLVRTGRHITDATEAEFGIGGFVSKQPTKSTR